MLKVAAAKPTNLLAPAKIEGLAERIQCITQPVVSIHNALETAYQPEETSRAAVERICYRVRKEHDVETHELKIL